MTDDNGRAIDRETYARAERFLPWNAEHLVFGLSIAPRWIGQRDAFWYRVQRRDGVRFERVDPETGSQGPAFDHARLAAALSRAAGTPYAATSLPVSDLEFGPAEELHFSVDGEAWTCDLATYACRRGEAPAPVPAETSRAADGQREVFVRDHNLWLRVVATGEERPLTSDGEAGYAYGAPIASPLVAAGLAPPEDPVAIWAEDGKRLLTCRIDQRQTPRFHLVQAAPPDGAIRPRLHSYAYPLPGDEAVPLAEVWCFDLEAGSGVRAGIPPVPVLYHGAPLSPEIVWWTADARRVFLLTRDRGFRAYRLWEIDAGTGTARQVIAEEHERGIDPYLFWGVPCVRPLRDGSEILWYAQRDGWGHLYLADGASGALVRQLTSGPGNVAEIKHVDEAGRWVCFTAMGREPERDPYATLLYRVSLDGGTPELLTPEAGDHAVIFAPSGRFLLDTASQVDVPPVTVVRRADGTVVRELERADITSLQATGWQPPERFAAKARDGVTDVYGVIVRPSRFDPERRYPVLDYIYAGPQVNVAPVSFADDLPFAEARRAGRGRGFWHAQALAELGFVVVMIDGLGMPGRGKAYHDVTYRDLGDGGIADHIVALRQLGDRYPQLDLERVGIYGHSAGGYASAHAILAFPEFYKVCVSSAGNHDHRLDKASWVERYMGLPVDDHYREQANQTLASRLQGKLLLIHGEMDENVHPASTLVLVDALIRENKEFDLLIIPNRPHRLDNDPYFVRRRWDYFVRHLLGAEPPLGYRIASTEGA